jgi:DNA-binding MarR family transcriptional regulator
VPNQVLTEQALQAWASLLRSHAALVGELNSQLVNEHGLTINDYEVLLQLSHAPERRMRRVDLAGSVLLTASGITRLLDGLERDGYVERVQCASDRRVTYAALTDAGREKLREAADTHLSGVYELFAGRFSDEELERLGELLGRIAGGDMEACEPA